MLKEDFDKIFHNTFSMLSDDGVLLFTGGTYFLKEDLSVFLKKTGFNFGLKKEIFDGNKKFDLDHGNFTLACKNRQISSVEDFKNLPLAAANYIHYYGFFDKRAFYLNKKNDYGKPRFFSEVWKKLSPENIMSEINDEIKNELNLTKCSNL